jgi:hypothetical protein
VARALRAWLAERLEENMLHSCEELEEISDEC